MMWNYNLHLLNHKNYIKVKSEIPQPTIKLSVIFKTNNRNISQLNQSMTRD